MVFGATDKERRFPTSSFLPTSPEVAPNEVLLYCLFLMNDCLPSEVVKSLEVSPTVLLCGGEAQLVFTQPGSPASTHEILEL